MLLQRGGVVHNRMEVATAFMRLHRETLIACGMLGKSGCGELAPLFVTTMLKRLMHRY